MTNEQRKEIRRLKDAGMGCSRIANTLGLSINTVKSYMRRMKDLPEPPITSASTSTTTYTCRTCGTSVRQSPGRKTKLYCSDLCRSRYWNHHPRAVGVCTCRRCGKQFTVYGRKIRSYCSRVCYEGRGLDE